MELEEFVDYARLSPSGANLQALKFLITNKPDENKKMFKNLAWAAYLVDWVGPEESERPTAYITILGDKNITNSFGCDYGIAAQSIMLGAVEKGYGGCMIASIKREKLRAEFNIPDNLEILLVLALGKPIEEVKIVDLDATLSVKYWRDENKVHYVPKRKLEEIIIKPE